MANWQDLSMSQRGDIIKMAVNSGVTDLNRIKKLYEESDAPIVDEYNYDMWRNSLPPNLSKETLDYNLRGAYEAGLEPTLEDDGYYHLGSRNPYTGEILKRGDHPTYLQALLEDARIGYYPYNKDGVTYTDTWQGNEALQESLDTEPYDELESIINEYSKGGKIKHKNEGFIPTNDDEFYRYLVNEEGFLKQPKDIGDGVITVGSGLTNPKYIAAYRKVGAWTEAMNKRAVMEEINHRRERLSKDIPNWNKLPETAKYALISYDYNYHLTAKKSPKLYAALRRQDWQEAAKQINATSKIPKFRNGLWNRRLREQNLFLRDFNNKPVIADRGPVLVNSTPSTVDLFMPARKALDFSQKAINYPTTRTAQATKALLTTIRDQVPEEQKNSPIFNIIPALDSNNPNIAQVPLSARDVSFNTITRPEIPQAELIPLDDEYSNEE